MIARKRASSLKRGVPPMLQSAAIPGKPAFSSSQTQQQRQEQAGHSVSGVIADFNFSDIPLLSPSNGVMQRTCDTCSKEYTAASRQSRAVKPESLCPKCRAGNALAQEKDRQSLNNPEQHFFAAENGSAQAQSTFDQGQSVKAAAPSKAMGETEETTEAKPRPYAGSATIQCNGSGGYEIVYNSWAGAKCGTKSCVTAHESSHIADWKAKWPSGCTGRAKGYLPKGDPPHDKPLMTVAEYNAFLKKSECKAHTVDLNCAKALPKKGACKKTVEDYITLTEKQLKKWCPSKAVIGAVIGAVVGATAGAVIGGPVGALVGGVAGAAIGGIAGALM